MGENERILRHRFLGMMARCYKEDSVNYKYYGGRGITVCDEWKDNFDNFYSWSIENGFRKDLSIDRIDNNKGYSPTNCKWATKEEQMYNRSMSVELTLDNKTMYMTEWSQELNIDKKTLSWRYRQGWSDEKILTTKPSDREIKITYKNETHTMSEWSKILNIPKSRLSNRKRRGWTDKETIEGKRENVNRSKVFIEYNGSRKSLKDWAEELGLNYKTLHYRYKKGFDAKSILFGK